MKRPSTDLVHWYRHFRRHQFATYDNSGLWINGIDARQFTGGGAAYQCHAQAAYWSARSHIAFIKRLNADVRNIKKRKRIRRK